MPQRIGKDLKPLLNLPRSAVQNYMRKQVMPPVPRGTAAPAAPEPQHFPPIKAFEPKNLWEWIWSYIHYRIGPLHPFATYAASGADNGVYTMQADTRIALAGDWATGTDEAAEVADQIQAFDAHYTIHLGDVYYVGDPDEVDENFLGRKNAGNQFTPLQWPAGTLGSFALLGNHEMYARGIAYFKRMLPNLGLMVDQKPSGQKASYFCLQNDHWRVIAVDTGYDSVSHPFIEYFKPPNCALQPELLAWLRDIVMPGDRRGVILLSHHQYISRYDAEFHQPGIQLAEFFPDRPVLWFWGHEHRMTGYALTQVAGGVHAHGRCIGHGGMPVDPPPDQPPQPQRQVVFDDPRYYPNDEGLNIGYNGFVQLTLSGERAEVAYMDLEGTCVERETWISDNGGVIHVEIDPIA